MKKKYLYLDKYDLDNYLKKDECKHRHIYVIHSRNLTYGVYDEADGGFIGIREKFGSKYLFKEYHYDNECFATVQPLEDLGPIPDELILKEGLGSECNNCHAGVKFIVEDEIKHTGKWTHTDVTECQEVYPVGINNQALFDFLKGFKC